MEKAERDTEYKAIGENGAHRHIMEEAERDTECRGIAST
jgi:hypothetical protein